MIDLKNDGPDGIKVDSEGNIYIAVGGNIGVYSPKGEKLTEIEVPNKSATNLCFGRGKWSKTLFITTSKKLCKLRLKKRGIKFSSKNSGDKPRATTICICHGAEGGINFYLYQRHVTNTNVSNNGRHLPAHVESFLSDRKKMYLCG